MLFPTETGMYTPGVINDVTIPTLLGICLGGSIFLVSVAAITCVCYRKRSLEAQTVLTTALRRGTSSSRKPSTPKRPSHVKSPGSGPPPGPTLKKSPSPTGSRSPPAQNPSPSNANRSGGGGGGGEGDEPMQGVTKNGNGSDTKPLLYGQNKEADFPDNSCAKFHTENEKLKQYEVSHGHLSCNRSEKVEVSEKGDYLSNEDMNRKNSKPKLGKLNFRLRHIAEKNALEVTIVRCTDLPAKDPNVGSSEPYVKLQLLPDKQHKVKTRVLRHTLHPVYDEDFTFYGIDENQLHSITLHFVVLSFDRYSRDDVIGEVVCPLSTIDFGAPGDPLDRHVSLFKDISPRNLKIRTQGRGELLVSLCYQPAANRLTVVVLKARNLPKIDITGLSDPYVKIYMLYNGQRIAKKKTHVKKRTVNPVFNESFVFDVPCNEGLDNVTLEFLVLDWDRVTKNEVIGKLELGGSANGGGGGGNGHGNGNGCRKIQPASVHHWQEVCNSPRRQIAEWHKLRE